VCGCASLLSLLVAGFFVRMRAGTLEIGESIEREVTDTASPVATT
jgi:hypothetical protein